MLICLHMLLLIRLSHTGAYLRLQYKQLSRSLGGLISLFLLWIDMESLCIFIGRLVHHCEKLPVSVPRLP